MLQNNGKINSYQLNCETNKKQTSGKIVVKWFSQSLRVGNSPGIQGSFPAKKSCNEKNSQVSMLEKARLHEFCGKESKFHNKEWQGYII